MREGDRRDRGPPLLRSTAASTYEGIARAAWARHPRRQGRPGRLDDHAAARPQPLHLARADARAQGQGGLPRDQARPALVEGQDPQDVHEPGLLRQPRLRHRGGGADVLLASRARKLTLPQAALLAGLPQAPSILRPVQQAGAARWRAGTQVLRAMLDERRHHPTRSTARPSQTGTCGSSRAGSTRASASRTSSATCATSCIARVRREHRALAAGCASTRRSTRASSARAARRSGTRSTYRDDPAAAVVSIDPANGAIRAMTAVIPGRTKQPVQPRSPRRAARPGSTFKTFVLAAAVEQGMNPDSDVLHLGAVHYRPTRSALRAELGCV